MKKFLLGFFGLIAGIFIFLALISLFSTGSEEYAKNEMDKITNQVAQDSVEQYNIAKRQGDKTQICVQAGLVSASYLQAKDEDNYNKWKSIEKTDCKNAGMIY